MADLHEATITPTKEQVIGPWLETRVWWDGVVERDPVGTFRLDDPAGEVGIECFLFGSESGSTLFVPVTYRAAALPGADAHLLGTMEHSVLGTRWVHDGCGDPVFMTTLFETIRAGGTHARLDYHRVDGSVVEREPTATVRGHGTVDLAGVTPDQVGQPSDQLDRTVVPLGDLTLTVSRRVGADLPNGPSLLGSFAGGDGLVLATIS